MPLVGAIEAGGTKFVCAVGDGPENIETAEVPTTTPEETIRRAVAFFEQRARVKTIGIGSFGPIDPNPESKTFGFITSTPKLAWKNFDFAGAIRDALRVEVAFDTDVNAAAFGEYRWGAGRGLHTFVYLTVGTGIGGGGLVNRCLMHGETHPEMGHIRIPHDREQDPFAGCCPYHGDCLEGLACAPAIRARWGQPGEALPDDHFAWDLEAQYLAYGIANWIFTLSPQRIILGGGVLRREKLYPLVRAKVSQLLNGYVEAPGIVAPELAGRAGVLGALALALELEGSRG